MKVIYTAGPIRFKGSWENVNEIHRNIERARNMARALWRAGWAVICPHTNTEYMDGPDITWDTFINGDLEIIARCDAMLMLPGWQDSDGARQEYAHAKRLGKKIYYDLTQVPIMPPDVIIIEAEVVSGAERDGAEGTTTTNERPSTTDTQGS